MRMAKAGRNRVCRVSITIQWVEEYGAELENAVSNLQPNLTQAQQQKASKVRTAERAARTQRMPVPSTASRLLPTDRIIIDALRRRVPEGDSATTPVSIKELMTECIISRRQVQICLRRLSEKKAIRRLIDEVSLGSPKGYRYQVF